jgi:DNA topoisomerase-6 subunit B
MQEEAELALKACGRMLKTHLNKKETKGKTKAKFEIVQEILPLIAQKSAKIVGKEVPSLNGTITKIMNVVWIDDSIQYESNRHKVRVTIYNYTPKSQSFNLHLVVPQGSLDERSVKPMPSEIKDGQKVTWELRRLSSTAKAEISFDLKGLDADAYEENEIYASGINPVFVIGADPLPGDWDVDALAVTEVEAPEAVEEAEEEEVDYDEQVEVLNDEQ